MGSYDTVLSLLRDNIFEVIFVIEEEILRQDTRAIAMVYHIEVRLLVRVAISHTSADASLVLLHKILIGILTNAIRELI